MPTGGRRPTSASLGDLLGGLLDAGVDFILVGGLAAVIQGAPLDIILAIGFRVWIKRGTQFRIWAIRNLQEYMVRGLVIDDERLKNPTAVPTTFQDFTIDSGQALA